MLKQLNDKALKVIMRLKYKLVIVAFSVALTFFVIPTFPAETSELSQNKSETAVDEEIKWLQAEAFDYDVVLASRKSEKLFKTAAAVYVITQEDIRRSSATNIPEVLRMVPGINVARIDANKWAVTSRGFNGRFANKLLVQIDGRSVYTPLFQGVFWDVQNVLLEDVDHIEVIKGPGGTLHESNAVNGVIRIITKKSQNTQGGLLTGMYGTKERAVGGFRYGGMLGKDAYYRFYARYFNHDDFGDTFNGHEGNDKWDVQHGGFRIDWDMSSVDSLLIKGGYYDGDGNELVDLSSGSERRDFDFSGANLLTSWKHVFSKDSDAVFQIYYDHTYRKAEVFRDKRDTFDLDLQHRFRLGSRQAIIWGLGYRFTSDGYLARKTLELDPNGRGLNLFSAFLQDEISIIDDLLRLTLGSKFSYRDYTGLEIQPTARILFTPSKRHTVWGAVSRAVKRPGRFDRDIDHAVTTFPLGPFNTGILKVLGSHDSVSEEMISYELGYRIQPIDNLSVDFAGFYSVYDNLQSSEVLDPFPISPTDIVFPVVDDNEIHGKTYGFEISANWNVTDYWKLKTGYTFLRMDLSHDGASTNFENEADAREGLSPNNQAHILSYLDLPHNLELDTSLYYVDHLTTDNVSSYLRLDMRLGWKPTKSLDMSIGMKNMLDGEHFEFSGTTSDRIESTEVERSVYVKITWQF